MANDPAINVTDWTSRLAYSADTQEIGWVKAVVLGTRGRSNPFHGLIGGINGMKPVTEVMDFKALAGQEIVVTLDRPLGGPGTQGPASLTRLIGREETVKHSTYRAKVGLFAHAVEGEQIVKTQTVIGKDWDNRQRRKLTEYFAWKQGDDIQFEMIVKAHARNTIYPNNKASRDSLTTNDYLNLDTATRVKQMLNANQAGPFDIGRSSSGAEILSYLIMASSNAFAGMSGSNAYQTLLSNADARGDNNKLFRGGLPNYFGTRLFDWSVEDGTQIGPLRAPISPIAYLGEDLPATSTTSLSAVFIKGGGNTDNAALTTPLYFQYFSNAAYVGHEGTKVAADTTTQRYVAIKILTGADVGKIALYGYTTNNGNKLGGLTRLGATNTGDIVDALGDMDYNSGAWTLAAGSNGFAGLTVGVVPAGSAIYEVNSKGVPFERGFGLGRNAILAGWGSLAPLGEGGQGGMPGQRLLQEQDAGRLYSLGYQQVWGATATKDANGMVNGYVLIESAYQPAGWPDITS